MIKDKKINIIKHEKGRRGITENLEFEILFNNELYYVECYLLDSYDTYAIRAYKTGGQELSGDTQVLWGYFDSAGGTFEGFERYQDNLEELENIILEHIFTNKLIKEF